MVKKTIIVSCLLVVMLFLVSCTQQVPVPKTVCEQTGIEGIHFGGNTFCKQRGYETCKEGYLVLEMKYQDPAWMPIGCSTPHSNELWDSTVEQVGKDLIEDGLYMFECCKTK